MDFGALLHYAKKKNDAATKDEGTGQGKYYSTKYAPPKKESKESKQLSNNIQKFLRKKEAEEAEKKREERQKLNNLLAKRDEKSKNKIRKMLKVTKSANKSVLEDANDGADGAHEAGEGQGDDYGYVSNEANAFYEKYIEKVRDVQEDKGFAPSRPQSLRDLSGTKERVKAAITKEREEARSHTRQRTSSVVSSSSATKSKEPSVARSYSTTKNLYDPEAEKREEERKKRQEEEQRRAKMKRPAQPPPMDFQALLRLAEKKQHEPVVFEPEKKKETERLLSAREKREMEERQRQKEQRALRDKMRETEAKEGPKAAAAAAINRMEPNGRIPKLNQAKPANPPSDNFKKPLVPPPAKARPSSTSSISSNSHSHSSTSRNSAPSIKPASKTAVGAAKPVATASSSSAAGKSSSVSSKAATPAPSKNPYAAAIKNGAVREFPPRDRPAVPSKVRPATPAVAKTRQFPPADVQKPSGGRQFPPADVKRRKPQEQPGNKRRIYDDDDDEYDSELDDFIDDGDCEEDISSHIRDIFGYDKRRYRGMDDDDRGMESSFAQMQREEFISKKLGMQEDLEDMRMEAAHKKQKMAKKRIKRIDDDDDD
ncbi:protein SPT2 homolog [Drosophila subpulchrella]|uniref:protein SPT2 homolog n=1 Tax=Drosophila subpulchrella TaxID=1486046 RepID=UPI0018A198C6|nr:protein SPT2 homolog [Drosophila subpulchrella]